LYPVSLGNSPGGAVGCCGAESGDFFVGSDGTVGVPRLGGHGQGAVRWFNGRGKYDAGRVASSFTGGALGNTCAAQGNTVPISAIGIANIHAYFFTGTPFPT
jgi:hypothetical protein